MYKRQASCDICARVNPAIPKTIVPLQPVKPVARVFGDRMHLDLVDMPRSAAGNVAICTIVDAATGFVIVVACPDKTHTGIINALRCRVFPHYGCPKVLVSDKGKENVNSATSKSREHSPFFLTFFRHPNFPFASLTSSRPSLSEASTVAARLNFSAQILAQAAEHARTHATIPSRS